MASKPTTLKPRATTRAGIGIPNKSKLASARVLPGKMPKAGRVRDTTADMPEPYQPPDEHHVSMRKISNGHVIRQHGYTDGKRFETETFSPTKPTVQFGEAKRAAKLAGKIL
jgi:hypothetical protein